MLPAIPNGYHYPAKLNFNHLTCHKVIIRVQDVSLITRVKRVVLQVVSKHVSSHDHSVVDIIDGGLSMSILSFVRMIRRLDFTHFFF